MRPDQCGNRPRNATIRHVLPQLGVVDLSLYSPAEEVRGRLKKAGEERRLNMLRHLGAFSYSVQGARQARWDYTVAIMHYAKTLKLEGMSNSFRLGGLQLSSALAALQCIALVWNCGHLPGTFAVEKAVYRFLRRANRRSPADALNWPLGCEKVVSRIRREANRLLSEEDYIATARVLGALKLLQTVKDPTDWFYSFTCKFAVPFLLNYDDPPSPQWAKLREAFRIARHLAYLTLDAPITGLQWAPNIPALLDYQVRTPGCNLEALAGNISEILSPVERMAYQSVYHSREARQEATLLANRAYDKLESAGDGISVIEEWLHCGLLQHLKLGKKPKAADFKIAASIRLRSHFSPHPDSPAQLEESMRRRKRFMFPAVFHYQAWNSEVLLEPDELIIDVMTKGVPTVNDVGKLAAWFIDNFDDVTADPRDQYELLKKEELDKAYRVLLSRAVELSFPGVMLRLAPWDLEGLGVFDETSGGWRTGIWAANARLDDRIIRHVLRKRSRGVRSALRGTHAELLGLAALRQFLKKQQQGKALRQKFLVATGSVRFCNMARDLIEYDGGMLCIASRGGALTWYGLETKRGSKDPAKALDRKLKALGISAKIHTLSSRHAVAEVHLSPR